jgi:DNA-binding transcriptional ArsR family regulator
LTEERSALDRVLNALNHPVRRDILRELAASPNSASKLAKTFEMDLGVVSYHLNKVLAKQCKVVELIDTVPRRGSIEKVYELRVGSSPDLVTAGKPGSWEEALWTMSMAESLLEAAEATKTGR